MSDAAAFGTGSGAAPSSAPAQQGSDASASDPNALSGTGLDQSNQQSVQPNDQTDPDAALDGGDESAEESGLPASDKLVVNGKEIELAYDKIKEWAQKGIAGEATREQHKREIAATREMKRRIETQQQGVKQLLSIVASGDLDTIAEFAKRKLGAKEFDQGVMKYVMGQIELSKMSPEQREGIEAKRQLEEMKRQQIEQQRAQAQRAYEQQVETFLRQINTELPKAMQSLGVDPKNEFFREQALGAWTRAVENGQKPTAEAVVNHVKQKLTKAGMRFDGTQQQEQPQRPKPRATRASVGLADSGSDPTKHISFSEWQRTRGR